ncbi:MAG TPA: PKD domain-containing protein [Pseudobdellovibrionaceae bacterium]|nr:PKD domain-containing protein [Pseudobdellovibrionaceae bacterium]
MLMRFFALANLKMRRPSPLPSITLLSIICSAFACGLLASEAHAQGGPPPRNQPPIAIISYASSSENPLQFHFDSSQSSDDVGIVSRRFQIENTWVTADQLTHTFTSFSKHRVKLEVVDGQNRRATADVEIDLTDLSHLVADEVLRPYESLSSSLSAQTIHTFPLQLRAGPARINLKNADGEAHAQQNCAPLEGLEYLACEAQNLIDQAYVDNFRVDSAQVFLNGKKVLGPLTDLQATLSGPVALTGNDVLEIRIEGPVTSYLQLEIQSLEVNLAPQASFIVAPPPKGVPALVLIDASSSTDPNDQVVAYRAEIQPDNIVTGFQSSPSFALSVPTAGPKLITITVQDRFGLVSSLTQDLTLEANLPPVVIANWVQTTSGSPFRVQVQADAFDPDDPRESLLYNFTFADGFTTGFTANPQVVRELNSVLSTSVTVQVQDPFGLTATVHVPIQTQINQLPIANFSIQPRNALAPATLNFDASASSDPDGDTSLLIYRWNFGDGETGTGRTITHTFQDPGEYTVRLSVIDEKRGVGVQNRIVFAWSSAPPIPRLSVSPATGSAPLLVNFNAEASTPGDTPIVRYVLLTGDGTTLESLTPHFQHTYQTPGTYSATLKVYDQDGDGNLLGQVIQVVAPQLLALDPRCETRTPAAEEL